MGVRQYGLEFRAHSAGLSATESPFESQLRMPTRELLVGGQVREAASKCQHRAVGFFGRNRAAARAREPVGNLAPSRAVRLRGHIVLKQGQVGHCLPQAEARKLSLPFSQRFAYAVRS
jgi:hypothetical protein